MAVLQRIKDFFYERKATTNSPIVDPGGYQFEGSLVKPVIPQFLYRPPFGYPRDQSAVTNRKLAANGYVHAIKTTIQSEVAGAEWDIVVKDGFEEDEDETKRIKEFFRNPNGNSESWEIIIRKVVGDVLDFDSGVLVKIFDNSGRFKQVMAFDGGSFLKNPDVHGYMGGRADIIPIYYFQYDDSKKQYVYTNRFRSVEDIKLVQEEAAYFQYSYNGNAIPIPFGKREVVWFSQNPRTDSVYGRSPLDVLGDVLYTLIYGASFNLDSYLNNNMPDGILQILGANRDEIRAVRERLESKFIEKDVFDNKRKKFFTIPVVNYESKFVPLNWSSKEMEVLEQQKWFHKLVCAVYNITPSEMGFTEDSNRSTEKGQEQVHKRKSIAPILNLIQYHINLQLMPELDPSGKYEYRYIHNDIQEDLQKAQLNQLYITMGVKTAEMVAEEMGVDVERLKREKEAQKAEIVEMTKAVGEAPPKPEKPAEQKAIVNENEPKEEMEDYFSEVEDELYRIIEQLPDKANDAVSKIE